MCLLFLIKLTQNITIKFLKTFILDILSIYADKEKNTLIIRFNTHFTSTKT